MTRRVVDPVRPRTLWAALLVAPVVGTTYFMVVYLLAEAACAPAVEGLGTVALRAVAYGTTAATVAVMFVAGVYAWALRRRGDGDDGVSHEVVDERGTRRFLGATGLILAGVFLFFVVLVAAPVVGSTLC